jgi:hypothetical protein
VEEGHHGGYVCSLVGTAGAIFAVNLSKVGDILWLPPAEENKVVNEAGMLVYAHESEERIKDLVVNLYPVVSQVLGGKCLVQKS